MVAQNPRNSRRLVVLLASALGLVAATAPARAEMLVFRFTGNALPRLKGERGGGVAPAAFRSRLQEDGTAGDDAAPPPFTTSDVLAVVLVVPAGTMPMSGAGSNLSSVTNAPGGSGTTSTSSTQRTTGGQGFPATVGTGLTESAPEPASICLALIGVGFGIMALVLRRRRQARRAQRLVSAGPARRAPRLAGTVSWKGHSSRSRSYTSRLGRRFLR
jgi:hypothetical protein